MSSHGEPAGAVGRPNRDTAPWHRGTVAMPDGAWREIIRTLHVTYLRFRPVEIHLTGLDVGDMYPNGIKQFDFGDLDGLCADILCNTSVNVPFRALFSRLGSKCFGNDSVCK